jgi:uncharacterized RDD family membrane protein YckC
VYFAIFTELPIDSMDPQTLDSGAIDQTYNPAEFTADAGNRFANLIVDTIAFYILYFILALVFGLTSSDYTDVSEAVTSTLFSWLCYFLYYFILETVTGKTLGKMITRTKVVDVNGQKPGTSAIALRTLSRLVPFEPFSFFGNPPRGWHDRWSKTWVVKELKTT